MNVRNAVLVVLSLCAAVNVAAWCWVVGGICHEPTASDALSGHTIPTACHGAEVFITPLENSVIHWCGPVFFGLGLAILGMRVVIAGDAWKR